MGPDLVVFFAPFNNAISGLWHALKPLFIQAFVSELSIEALDVAVLHGPARLNQNVANAIPSLVQTKKAQLVNSGPLSVRTATGSLLILQPDLNVL